MIDTSSEELTERYEQQQETFRQVGAELRQQREARGLDQREAGQALRLPGMIINDLETGRVEHLSSIYRRGYIRNYARLLEMDAAALLARIDEDAMPPLQQVMPASKGQWQFERYLKIVTYAVVTIAIVAPLAYSFIANGSRIIDREASLVEPRLAEQNSSQPAIHGPMPLSGRNQASGSEEAGHVSASVLPLSPIRPQRKTEPPAPLIADPPDDVVVPVEPDPALSSQIRLELLEDSWIEIHDAAGTRLEYDLMRAGQQRMYQGEPPFTLLLGRSSAVSLELNGKLLAWEGQDSADVARIRIGSDGAVEH